MTIGTLCRCGRINCDQHPRPNENRRARNKQLGRDLPRWQRLSRQARERQPFCSRCGSTDNLHAHLPGGGDHRQARLEELEVVCAFCHPAREFFQGDAHRRPRPGTPAGFSERL